MRLINKLIFHRYGGKRELLGLLTTASAEDARKLIRLFGWDRLHERLDERFSPFKDRFPRRVYAK